MEGLVSTLPHPGSKVMPQEMINGVSCSELARVLFSLVHEAIIPLHHPHGKLGFFRILFGFLLDLFVYFRFSLLTGHSSLLDLGLRLSDLWSR